MPAAVSVPNTFVAATTAQSAQVNANFAALVAWINTNAVPLDGTKPMTGTLSGPAGVDPTTADQYARKAYVDATAKAPARSGTSISVTNQSIPNSVTTLMSFTTEVWDSDAFFTPTSTTITIPAGMGGLYLLVGSMYGIGSFSSTSGQILVNGVGLGFLNPSAAGSLIPTAFTALLAAGNTVQVNCFQSNGPSINVSAALTIARISL